MSKATLGALLPYYGAKRQKPLRDRIIAELGDDHVAYKEGCCGSAAVFLAKPRKPMEVINDLNGDVVNLARVLASKGWRELHERLEQTLICSDLYEEMRDQWKEESETIVAPSVAAVREEHLVAAYRFLVCSWQGINGVTGTGRGNSQLARRYTAGGGAAATRWRGVIDSVPAWHDRLLDAMIDRVDVCEDLAKTADDGTWAIYLDPPYYRKGDKYVHEFTPEKHAELAAVVRSKKNTRIVVSYYDEPEVRDLYRGFTIIEVPITKALVNQGRRDCGGAVKAREILILNGPSFVSDGGLFA